MRAGQVGGVLEGGGAGGRQLPPGWAVLARGPGGGLPGVPGGRGWGGGGETQSEEGSCGATVPPCCDDHLHHLALGESLRIYIFTSHQPTQL